MDFGNSDVEICLVISGNDNNNNVVCLNLWEKRIYLFIYLTFPAT